MIEETSLGYLEARQRVREAQQKDKERMAMLHNLNVEAVFRSPPTSTDSKSWLLLYII